MKHLKLTAIYRMSHHYDKPYRRKHREKLRQLTGDAAGIEWYPVYVAMCGYCELRRFIAI
jgi:hypothetical protein